MPTISDYLLKAGASTVQSNVFVRLTNNITSTSYVSTAVTDSNGMFTANNVPSGQYTVATGPTSGGPWTATGDANYEVSPTLLNLYNPLDFGPAPTGSNDNFTALQAAVTAAGVGGQGGLVQIPNLGVKWLTSAPILIPSHVTIDLGGSMIQAVANSNTTVLQNADSTNGNTDITIRNGWIDGNKTNQGTGGDALQNGILLYGGTDLTVDAVKIQQCKGRNLYVRGTLTSAYGDRILITRCWLINGLGYNGIYGNRITAIGNTVLKTEANLLADGYNIGGSAATGYCIFQSNRVINTGGNTSGGDGFAIDGLNDGLIEGNIVDGMDSGCRLYTAVGSLNVRIIGNRFNGRGGGQSYYGVLVGTHANNVGYDIADNHITNFTDVATGYGIFLSQGPGDVHGNRMSGNRANQVVWTTAANAPHIWANPPFNPFGIVGGGTTPAIQAVPASGSPITNNTGLDVMVYITAGSGAITAITVAANQINGVTIGIGATGGPFRLPANSTIQLTYTGTTPTWQWWAD